MSQNKSRRRPRNASVYSIVDQKEAEPTEKEFSQNHHSIKNIPTDVSRPSRWWVIALICFLSLGVLGAGLKYLEDSVRDEIAKQKQNPLAKNDSLLTKVNPFMPVPTPDPTPQLSKEYVYAGSRLLAVEDAAASAIPPEDLAVWRPSNGYWYCLGGAGSQAFTVAWGMSGDIPEPGDYDNDGKTDLAIFRPSTGTWWILRSSDGGYSTQYAGTTFTSGDGLLAAQADYDGDGKTDPAVFKPATQVWYIYYSSTSSVGTPQFGSSSDKPAAADYDGDGKADIAIWRDSEAKFYIYLTSLSQQQTQALGSSGSAPVPGDYDGDGKADLAIRHGADWVIKQSSDGSTLTTTWEKSTDIAVQNDYDGDGKVDIAIWRPDGKGVGNWYIRNSHNASTRVVAWGAFGDIPVPALYRR
jgi:hypothetical protein